MILVRGTLALGLGGGAEYKWQLECRRKVRLFVLQASMRADAGVWFAVV